MIITLVLAFVFLHEQFYRKIFDRMHFDRRRNSDDGALRN